MLNAARITGASISTHALTEGDVAPILFSTPSRIISTHALTEGDTTFSNHLQSNHLFQLTPSRRATEQVPFGVYAVEFQLTPSRRATYFEGISTPPDGISTHALTEGDRGRWYFCTHF